MEDTPRGALCKRPRIASSGNLSADGSKSDTTPRHASKETLRSASSFEKPTPKSRLFNPFERQALELSDRPVCSPSVFQVPVNTPPQAAFKWDIEQISRLYPSNFEDSPSTHQTTEQLSEEHESRIQSNIISFFETHHMPSPAITASTPISKKGERKTVDKCIGTDLSFPMDLPDNIMEMLGKYCRISKHSEFSSEEDELDGDMPPPPETNSFGRYRENLNETETSIVGNSSFFRRKLEFSFDSHDDSMRSEEASVIDVAAIHGALILSP